MFTVAQKTKKKKKKRYLYGSNSDVNNKIEHLNRKQKTQKSTDVNHAGHPNT